MGYDDLYGQGGDDTFVFLSASAFNSANWIYDFNISTESDVIDSSDVLS